MTSKDLRNRARTSIAASTSSVVLTAFVYYLLTTCLTTVVNLAVGSPLDDYSQLVSAGIDPTIAIRAFSGTSALLSMVLDVAIALFVLVMSFGFQFYMLRVLRQEESSLNDLFFGFSRVGRVLGVELVLYLYLLLWAIVFSIPLLAVLFAFSSGISDVGLSALMVVWAVLMVVAVMLVACRYAQALYLVMDRDELGPLAAMRESKRLMRGNVWRFIRLFLSFLGWFVIFGLVSAVPDILTNVIAIPDWLMSLLTLASSLPMMLWLVPYVSAATAAFYEDLIGQPSAAPGDLPVYPGTDWK